MTTFVPKTPSGYTIFCDDVRQESNGKLLYIGVYTGELVIGVPFPLQLPGFVPIVHYLERLGESDQPVSIKMFVPGQDDPLVIFEMPIEQMRRDAAALPPGPDDLDRVMRTSIPLRISPFLLAQEGVIKVRAYRGEDEIRLGTLKVSRQQGPIQTVGIQIP